MNVSVNFNLLKVKPRLRWRSFSDLEQDKTDTKSKSEEVLVDFLDKVQQIWPFKDYPYSEEDVLEYLKNSNNNIESVLHQFMMISKKPHKEVNSDKFSDTHKQGETGIQETKLQEFFKGNNNFNLT